MVLDIEYKKELNCYVLTYDGESIVLTSKDAASAQTEAENVIKHIDD